MPLETLENGKSFLEQRTKINAAIDEVNSITDGTISGGIPATATGTTTPRTLGDRFADIINVKDFGAKGDGLADDTTSINSAISYAVSVMKPLYFPSGIYMISQSGVFNTRGYGILLKSNLTIVGASKYNTILRSLPSADIDMFNTDRTSPQVNISISNITLDGNEQNRTGTVLTGFNLWVYGVTNLEIENVLSINTGSWGLRIQECNYVDLKGIRCNHSAESNSDGIHFVDTSNVVGTNIDIYTEGDDAFIIEANTKDVISYNISSLSVSAPNGLALPARGVLLLVDHDTATGAWEISDIEIDAIIKDCSGHGVILTGGKYSGVNVKAIVTGGCSFAGLYLQPGFTGNTGYLVNSSFDIVVRDVNGSGMISVTDFGTITDNNVNINLYNPAEEKVGANIRGDRWSGQVKSNYNPNSDKTAFAQGVVVHGSDNNLLVDSIGSQVNLLLQSTAQNNNIKLGQLKSGTVYDLQITSGSEGNIFTGGSIYGAVFIPFGNTTAFTGVKGLYRRFKTTIDMSVNGDGTAQIPHGLLLTPNVSLVQLNTGTVFNLVVSSQGSTNIGVTLNDNAGSPIITGVYDVLVSTSV